MSSRRATDSIARGARTVTLPNLLSLLRIALVPVLVVTLMVPGREARALAGAWFLIASVTDFLDGWFARRQGLISGLGQMLDPLADKLIVAAALIMLVAVPPEPRVPAWMAVVLILREIAVTGLRGIASGEGIAMPAEELGKYKTLFQMFALVALLVHYPYGVPGTSLVLDFRAAGMVFLWMAVVLSLWSGVAYHVRILRHVRLE